MNSRVLKPSKKSAKVRVAFIGAGGHANRVHYPSLTEMPDVEIVAVCDLHAARRDATADRFGIERRFDDYVDMIERTDPDAVYAIMPPHHVYGVAAQCMEMGRNLLIDKPPSVTSEQCRQMAILAERHGCITAVGFQRRFAPVLVEARRLVEERGPIHTCVVRNCLCAVGGAPYYKGAMDILTCHAIHAVDTMRWAAAGSVTSVASDVRRLLATHCTSHMALATFDSGVTGMLITNWMTGARPFQVELHGPGISAFVEPEHGGVVYADGRHEPVCTLSPSVLVGSDRPHRQVGFYQENRHFIDCVKSGRQPQMNLSEALKTMELVDRIYESQI